jgi:xanthosine utilization system XapX-like protein
MLPKMLYILNSILLVAVVASVLGVTVGEVSSESKSDREIVLNEALGSSAFSGQIVPIALNPQPEPPRVYKLGMNVGMGLFSGKILSITLNPQPEPPLTAITA